MIFLINAASTICRLSLLRTVNFKLPLLTNGTNLLTDDNPRRQTSTLFLERAVQNGEGDVGSPFESEGSGLEHHCMAQDLK